MKSLRIATHTTIPLDFPTWARFALIREFRLAEERWKRRIPPEGIEGHESMIAAHTMMASLYRELRIQIEEEDFQVLF